MSAGHLRKEKNCLNCNARVFGPYCHICGQHNVEPKETVWGLIVHFFNDLTHFEGKFITSLRYLLLRPGFLTAEYERGRRVSYMNPVRMYVFTSAFFFILFFSFFDNKEEVNIVMKEKKDSTDIEKTIQKMNNPTLLQLALQNADNTEDSADIYRLFGNEKDNLQVKKDTGNLKSPQGITGIIDKNYKTPATYDSVQAALPENDRDNWLKRALTRRLIIIDEKYNSDAKKFIIAVYDYAIHVLPKMLFISLPVFAFFLWLLYIRHKRFFYVTHIIFAIHFHVFVFTMLLLIFTSEKINQIAAWWPSALISAAAWFYMFVYLYKAMRRLYEQGRAKTVLKYTLLIFFLFILYTILFIGLFSYSVFNV